MIIKGSLYAGSALSNFHSSDKEETADYLLHCTEPEEIWINGKEEYPCLSILVKGNYACLHYFECEGNMWQSFGKHTEEITFLAGGIPWEAPANTVIPVEDAVLCMEAFFNTMQRPDCIEWQEL